MTEAEESATADSQRSAGNHDEQSASKTDEHHDTSEPKEKSTPNDRGTQSGGNSTEDETGRGESGVEVTPQSEALRRQQYVVGVIVAALSGVAITISIVQNFSAVPVPLSMSSGVVGTGVVYWVVQNSLFPAESTDASE